MGLLDQVLGGVLGGSGGGASPMQGILMNLLGGQQNNQGQQSGTGGGLMDGAGGLGNLVSMFQQAGLGNVVQSWISNGSNHPVSPDQLQSVLGQDQVQTMASQAGMQPNDFLSQLSQHLPKAVDGMTPNGRLPDEGSASV